MVPSLTEERDIFSVSISAPPLYVRSGCVVEVGVEEKPTDGDKKHSPFFQGRGRL